MRVKLLGTAAGGAFPQWNCACHNCRSLREGHFSGKPRSQLEVAISRDEESWFLLNASPDIRSQLEQDAVFYPRQSARTTPIAGIVLTSADLDHVLGLLMLREFEEFRVYATPTLERVLREDNSMFSVLNRISAQVTWVPIIPGQAFPLLSKRGKPELCCKPVALGEHVPSYISKKARKKIRQGQMLVGLIIESPSGRRLGYFPSIPEISSALVEELATADVILVDGTFWSDDELHRVRGEGPAAPAMGHVPISGPEGSLARLSSLKARKIYVHINNTNPLLDESSRQYHEVRAAGWEVGEDGWEFEL